MASLGTALALLCIPTLAYADVYDDVHKIQTKTLTEFQLFAALVAVACGIKVFMGLMSAASSGEGGGRAGKAIWLWGLACVGMFAVIPWIQMIKKQMGNQTLNF